LSSQHARISQKQLLGIFYGIVVGLKRCPTLTDFSLGKRISLARPLFPNNSDRIILQYFAILCIFITKKNAASVFFVEN
jgi:hypothetical protein